VRQMGGHGVVVDGDGVLGRGARHMANGHFVVTTAGWVGGLDAAHLTAAGGEGQGENEGGEAAGHSDTHSLYSPVARLR
jgi:hypothetical protein